MAAPQATTNLFEAIEQGRIDLVKNAIASNRSILGIRDVANHSPLFSAVLRERDEIVMLLLQHGANADAAACGVPNGATLLHYAAALLKRESVLSILRSGIDISVHDQFGQTALHWAARWGSLDTVRTLIENGADIGATDNWGWTPLFYAAGARNASSRDLLIHAGADATLCDKWGRDYDYYVKLFALARDTHDCSNKDARETARREEVGEIKRVYAVAISKDAKRLVSPDICVRCGSRAVAYAGGELQAGSEAVSCLRHSLGCLVILAAVWLYILARLNSYAGPLVSLGCLTMLLGGIGLVSDAGNPRKYAYSFGLCQEHFNPAVRWRGNWRGYVSSRISVEKGIFHILFSNPEYATYFAKYNDLKAPIELQHV